MNQKKHYKKYNTHKRYKTDLCEDNMTFDDCELAILRHSVDETEKIQGKKIANDSEIKRILEILEIFLRRKKLVCYGGTAINNILPLHAQFYNRDVEIPDYDFYSPNALDDAKELADIYHKEGYLEVEAKSGVHVGTYKVFVNFIGIADITYLHKPIFEEIYKESITINGIHYAPPNFLRMNMYLELSRPAGDVSRWEKIFKRLVLLNTHYPFDTTNNCNTVDFQRNMEDSTENSEKIYYIIRDSFIDQNVIFFGGYASSLYSRYMKKEIRHIAKNIPDFDVLSENPEICSRIVKERLQQNGFKKVKLIHHKGIEELIPEHIEIRIENETLAFIYKPIACHSYNTIHIQEKPINVATIDTILTFYLAFIYAKLPYYTKDRLLCMAKFLFDVEQENRLQQKGLLKRFSIHCYGSQKTMEEIRSEKANKYNELMNDKNSKEYQKWFLKYNPGQHVKPVSNNKMRTKNSRTRKITRKSSNFLI